MIKKIVETAVILFGTLGWWGFVYPELSLLESGREAESAYEQSNDLWQDGEVPAENYGDGNIGNVMIQDCNSKIRIKSKIAEYICQVRENTRAEKENQDDKQKRTHRNF